MDNDDGDADLKFGDEIESDSDSELSDNYGMMGKVPANSENSTISPIDCYWYFITDKIISLMVRETNRYTERHLHTQKLTKRSKTLQWRRSTNEEILKFLGIIIDIGLLQMPEIDYY